MLVNAKLLFLGEMRGYIPEGLWSQHFHQPINVFLVYMCFCLKISYLMHVDLTLSSPSAALLLKPE